MEPKWRQEARRIVFEASYGPDPDMAPVYRIPKPKPWWAFWRKREWEEVRGISRTHWAEVAKGLEAYYASQRKETL